MVVAVGWMADTVGLSLATAGVETDPRGWTCALIPTCKPLHRTSSLPVISLAV